MAHRIQTAVRSLGGIFRKPAPAAAPGAPCMSKKDEQPARNDIHAAAEPPRFGMSKRRHNGIKWRHSEARFR